MRYLSLFSGIEAASVAWLPLGWECVAVAEVEPFPCAVLKHHYPDVPNLGDITKITEEQIIALGHIDLIVGGFPCQDLSVAGKRKGLKDSEGNNTRSGLFYEAMRIVRQAREHSGLRYVVIENVPGLFSSHDGRDFASVVGEISGAEFAVPEQGWQNTGAALGPDGLCEWGVLDARWFGVAQRRRRVFFVGDFGDWAGRPPILFERESLCWDFETSREARKSPARSVAIGIDEECNATTEGFGSLLRGGQGGTRQAVAYENHAQDSRITEYGDMSPQLNARAGTGGNNLPIICSELYSIMPMNSGKDYKARKVDVAQPLMAGGPVGGNQGGDVVICMETGQASAGIGIGTTLNCNHEAPIIAIQDGRGMDKHQNGKGFNEDGTAYTLDGVSQQAVAFVQNTRDEVRLMNGDGGIVGALSAEPGAKQQCYVAFSCKDHGADAGDVSPTLRSMGHDGSHANGGGQVAVADTARTTVRRITPTEAERLQGFKEGYTMIAWGKKPIEECPDGARYKALGNSMATPVMRWIGMQIDKVSKSEQSGRATD